MPEAVDTLHRLGLTEWGARAYQALVGLGETSATAVSEAAQLPRTKVYAVLDELVQKGWAEVQNTRPKAYRPVDPRARLGSARSEFLAALDAAEEELVALYKQEGVQFGGPMWVVHGAEAIRRRATTMVRHAHDTVFLSLPFGMPGDDEFLGEVEVAAKRGCVVRVILPPGAPEDMVRRVSDFAEIRHVPFPLRALFIDLKQSLLAFQEPAEDGSPTYRGVWNPHPEMVRQLGSVANGLWQGAPRIDASDHGGRHD